MFLFKINILNKLTQLRLIQLVQTWPNASKSGTPVYLGALVGGVVLKDSDGHFNFAKSIRMVYNLNESTPLMAEASRRWMKQLKLYIIDSNPSGSHLITPKRKYYANKCFVSQMQICSILLCTKMTHWPMVCWKWVTMLLR